MESVAIHNVVRPFLEEDDLFTNFGYISSLPDDRVRCSLKLKDDLVVAGLPFFFGTFSFLGAGLNLKELLAYEGKFVSKGDTLEFDLPFGVALTGERVALNLLQMASSIATHTKKFVDKAYGSSVKILDTRKTTPGHRALEKYAVLKGGGFNHRFGQTDCFMIKDNHKTFFGGLAQALSFFKSQNSFYRPIVVEIHDLEELKQAQELGVTHLMLDNFSPDQVREAVKLKKPHQTYEISGGIRLENLEDYLLEGVDAISSGSLTYDAPHVDISLKYKRV